MSAPAGNSRLGEIARPFLRLGLTAFGGPAAHLSLMQREFAERRAWLSRAEFLDLVGACNLLPGPSSTQVAMALGFRRAGWMGLIAAGTAFILPSALATLALAWTYVRYGSLPQAQGLLYGAKPVMVAILIQAVWNLGRMAFRRWPLALLGLACFAAAIVGAPPIAVLLASGASALLVEGGMRAPSRPGAAPAFAWMPLGLGGATLGAPSLAALLFVFLKLGVVVFGSGYVLLAFLKADLVDRLHWVTQSQLLDAVIAGQLTPGPVFATATFLGYLLRGWAGAAVATMAIFLPSFPMAALAGVLAARVRNSPLASAFLDGVNAAAIALMASVAIVLGRAALVDGWTWMLGLTSAVLLIRFRLNATWLILVGAGVGLLLRGLA